MMKFTKGIRFRIIAACVFFAFMVSIIFGLILIVTIKINADEQFNWHIEKEATHFLKQYQKNKNIKFEIQRGIVRVTNELDAITQLKKMLAIDDKQVLQKSLKDLAFNKFQMITEDGYMAYKFHLKEKKIYVLQASLEDKENLSLYYFIDLSGFNKSNNMGANISRNIFFIMIFIILLLAILIGFYIAKKVLVPLTSLSTNVDKIDIGEYKSNTSEYYNDEIGFLAKKIDSFVKRTAKFVQREKAFSRDASHELRTPVASSQAALDVAFALPQGQNPRMNKILQRVQRANKNMTHLIESFLILGREKQKDKKILQFNLKELVDTSISKNSYLINSQTIKYENKIDETIIVNLPKEYLLIIIDNLIRNAFTHMQDGIITINATNNYLLISDTGEWFDDTKELGIGLNIVKRICTEENWKIDISTVPNIGTQIKIKF